MSFVDLPLPNRSIAVAERPFAAPAGFLFAIVTMLALFGFFAVWQGPGLWRDIQINQNPLTLPQAEVLDGECSTRRGLTDCDARLVYDYKGKSYDTQVSLAFIDFSGSDYLVDVVISADKPELATLSLGLEMLWNRLAVFAVLILIFAGGAIAMVLAGLRAWNSNRAAATPGRVQLVPVQITDTRNGFVSYADYRNGKRSPRVTRTKFARGQEPLMAVDASGNVVAVAVQAEHIKLPVLLDRGLERLALSDVERRNALAAFDAEQSGRDAVVQIAAAKPSLAKRALRGLIAVVVVLVLAAVGIGGYWLYYVTNTPDAFDSLGMEINNLMPEPLNLWGCTQLEARFGDERAPFGCVADDYQSWKTRPTSKTKS
jgi:hypothetical protein